MFTFSVSDSFYRFNCTPDASPLEDASGSGNLVKSKLFILPYPKKEFAHEILNDTYSFLNPDLETVIIFIPTYNFCSGSLMTFSIDMLDEIDKQISIDYANLQQLREKYEILSDDFEFEYEEILKVHIDFIKKYCPKVKILPLLYYNLSNGIISEILSTNWGLFSFIFLSNMSSGFNYKDANQIDNFTANNIEANLVKDISFERFSGFHILPELLNFVENKGYSFVRLCLKNSADFNVNFASTTGYGSWMLYEGSCAEYIKKYYSDIVINFVKFNIKNNAHIACSECFNFPEVFNQEFKIFISLEKDGFVRGVNGSFKTLDKLFKAIVKRSFGVAFSDNRFAPVQPDEIDWLKINVVILQKKLMNSIVIES